MGINIDVWETPGDFDQFEWEQVTSPAARRTGKNILGLNALVLDFIEKAAS
jgi:hypothetical protein